MRALVRAVLRLVGKDDRKIAAVFALTAATADAAVKHLRSGAPDVPVWLFSAEEVPAETAALCEHVEMRRRSVALFLTGQRKLWPHWVAIGVTTWTGAHGKWAVKWAPFWIPPFRALVLNENGDFFRGSPAGILRHAVRRLRDLFHSGWHTLKDVAYGYWRLVSYHVWLSGPVTRVKDEVSGLALLATTFGLRMVAAVLGWCGMPYQALFHRRHGDRALHLMVQDSGARDGVSRFSRPAKVWDSRRFEAFARKDRSRWVLWEEEGKADRVEDWLPLFDDPRTFAVSRQENVRAWKRLLFPTAPFRTLQPGEVSQVLAPLSGSVLVDREKLLALGIPRASLAGTAWMLLFWKAAAAGWRSYSVGPPEMTRLREQPDLPMQDTGFLLCFLASRELRALGPREPDLSRGSIAFHPSRQPANGSAERLKVLLVSPFLPYPLSHGGAVRIFNLCRALKDRVDFVLAAVREAQDVTSYDKLREVFREIYVVDKDERASGSDDLPAQVREHQSRPLRALIGELARTWRPDLLQIEYTHIAGMREAAPEVPSILVEHDLTFSLYRQLSVGQRPGGPEEREYHRWLNFESNWLGVYDAVWTVSEEDCAVAAQQGRRRPGSTFAIANGVDIERFVPSDEPTPVPEIFYVGSFRHLPNILGFVKLMEQVMPLVWRSFPEARLRVVAGPEHEMFWQRSGRNPARLKADARVKIHGFVEDLRPLYARASVVVVPLEVSAGTNIKVLEAMACGKAVVTTPIGCAGLGLRDREDAFIDGDWSTFADSAGKLLSHPELCAAVAAQARRTVEARFSWTAIAAKAYESYRTILGQGGTSVSRTTR